MTEQTPVPPPAAAQSAGPAGVPVSQDPDGPGIAAPNSEMVPARGLPLVPGPAQSARAGFRAGGLNLAFLAGGIIGLVLVILIVVILLKIIF